MIFNEYHNNIKTTVWAVKPCNVCKIAMVFDINVFDGVTYFRCDNCGNHFFTYGIAPVDGYMWKKKEITNKERKG